MTRAALLAEIRRLNRLLIGAEKQVIVLIDKMTAARLRTQLLHRKLAAKEKHRD